MAEKLPATSVAEHLAASIVALRADKLPPALREKCEELLIDVVGLCVTARKEGETSDAGPFSTLASLTTADVER